MLFELDHVWRGGALRVRKMETIQMLKVLVESVREVFALEKYVEEFRVIRGRVGCCWEGIFWILGVSRPAFSWKGRNGFLVQKIGFAAGWFWVTS